MGPGEDRAGEARLRRRPDRDWECQEDPPSGHGARAGAVNTRVARRPGQIGIRRHVRPMVQHFENPIAHLCHINLKRAVMGCGIYSKKIALFGDKAFKGLFALGHEHRRQGMHRLARDILK